MKVLLAIPHYFRPEPDPKYASAVAANRPVRAAAVRATIEAWRGHLGPFSSLNMARQAFEPVPPMDISMDIAVLVHGQDHLLDDAYCAARGVNLTRVETNNPRLLGFAARILFAKRSQDYDMFVYSEDDLRPADGFLLPKIATFVETVGWRRLVLPNRFEWNAFGPALKTFIDGDIAASVIGPYLDAHRDAAELRLPMLGRELAFRRAANPHSGFFALTAQQLAHWMAQPHFSDMDASFIGPLESAATLGILKTFPIYKAHGRDSGWLEIEHLSSRFSRLDLPRLAAQPAERVEPMPPALDQAPNAAS